MSTEEAVLHNLRSDIMIATVHDQGLRDSLCGLVDAFVRQAQVLGRQATAIQKLEARVTELEDVAEKLTLRQRVVTELLDEEVTSRVEERQILEDREARLAGKDFLGDDYFGERTDVGEEVEDGLR